LANAPTGGQHSITRAVVPGSIRKAILPVMWASCRPMPLMDTTSSTRLKGSRLRFEAACWSHGRRKFVDLVKQGEAPIASEAVRRIDMLFEIERSINGKTPEQRLAARREQSRRLIAEFEIWMHQQRALLSTKNDTAKAINYLLNRWAAFTRFLDNGRVCLTNNAAERALRGVAVGRRNWTFAGSDAGGHRAAAVYTLIETCKMNDVDPQAWLADVLATLPDHLANKVADLLPWNWKANQQSKAAVAA
jgi:transposase